VLKGDDKKVEVLLNELPDTPNKELSHALSLLSARTSDKIKKNINLRALAISVPNDHEWLALVNYRLFSSSSRKLEKNELLKMMSDGADKTMNYFGSAIEHAKKVENREWILVECQNRCFEHLNAREYEFVKFFAEATVELIPKNECTDIAITCSILAISCLNLNEKEGFIKNCRRAIEYVKDPQVESLSVLIGNLESISFGLMSYRNDEEMNVVVSEIQSCLEEINCPIDEKIKIYIEHAESNIENPKLSAYYYEKACSFVAKIDHNEKYISMLEEALCAFSPSGCYEEMKNCLEKTKKSISTPVRNNKSENNNEIINELMKAFENLGLVLEDPYNDPYILDQKNPFFLPG